MFSLLKNYELWGAKRRVRLFNRFQIESVLKIAPYHTQKFGGIGKLAYLCIVIQERWESQVLKLLPFQGVHPTKSTFNIQQSTLKIKDYGSKRNIEIS